MTSILFCAAVLAVAYIGIVGWKSSTQAMGVMTIAFIVVYVGSLMLGSTDGLPSTERGVYLPDNWSPLPNRWAPGPFIRSFMETGAIGELIAMPAMGIFVVGLIMIPFTGLPGAGVAAVGGALMVLAGMTDSYNAGFDAARHSGALIKFAIGGILLFFVIRYMFGRSRP